MADGEPKRPHYALPAEYGPARATTKRSKIPPTPPSAPSPATLLRRKRRLRLLHRRRRAASTGAPRARAWQRRTRSTKSRWIRRGIAIAVVILLIPVALSYVDYLNRPGSDTLSVTHASSGSATTAATAS